MSEMLPVYEQIPEPTEEQRVASIYNNVLTNEIARLDMDSSAESREDVANGDFYQQTELIQPESAIDHRTALGELEKVLDEIQSGNEEAYDRIPPQLALKRDYSDTQKAHREKQLKLLEDVEDVLVGRLDHRKEVDESEAKAQEKAEESREYREKIETHNQNLSERQADSKARAEAKAKRLEVLQLKHGEAHMKLFAEEMDAEAEAYVEETMGPKPKDPHSLDTESLREETEARRKRANEEREKTSSAVRDFHKGKLATTPQERQEQDVYKFFGSAPIVESVDSEEIGYFDGLNQNDNPEPLNEYQQRADSLRAKKAEAEAGAPNDDDILDDVFGPGSAGSPKPASGTENGRRGPVAEVDDADFEDDEDGGDPSDVEDDEYGEDAPVSLTWRQRIKQIKDFMTKDQETAIMWDNYGNAMVNTNLEERTKGEKYGLYAVVGVGALAVIATGIAHYATTKDAGPLMDSLSDIRGGGSGRSGAEAEAIDTARDQVSGQESLFQARDIVVEPGNGFTQEIKDLFPGRSPEDYLRAHESALREFGGSYIDGIDTYTTSSGEVGISGPGNGNIRPEVMEFLEKELSK